MRRGKAKRERKNIKEMRTKSIYTSPEVRSPVVLLSSVDNFVDGQILKGAITFYILQYTEQKPQNLKDQDPPDNSPFLVFGGTAF